MNDAQPIGSGAVYSFDPVGSYEREACRAAGAAQSLVQPFLDNQVSQIQLSVYLIQHNTRVIEATLDGRSRRASNWVHRTLRSSGGRCGPSAQSKGHEATYLAIESS